MCVIIVMFNTDPTLLPPPPLLLFLPFIQVLVEFWPNSTEVRAPNSKLTVFCSVISNSGIFWKANGKFINDWSESYSPGIDLTNTDVRDVIGGKMYNYTVEVRVSPQINNTVLECFSLGSSSVGVTTLIVAG